MGRSHGAPARPSAGGSLLRGLGTVALCALVFAVAYHLVLEQAAENAREARQREAVRRTQQAARAARLAANDLAPVLALCRDGWRDELGLLQEPVALAWTRRGLDAYFVTGTDRRSLRQVRCDARGVSLGPRVAHPLERAMPAEAPVTPEPHLDLGALSTRTLAAQDLALELLAQPLTGALVSRRWRAGEDGAQADLEPADAPSFPLLVSSPDFRPASRLPGLSALRRHRWTAEADAAFAVIGRALPKGARIAEITLSPDKIEVTIDSPTTAFDGRPPVRYGDKTFDEYGVAETDWWYPREIPGFGCANGSPLAQVGTDFAVATARLSGRPLASAWYSCSTAYSNGRNGAWHLQPQGS